MADKDGNEPFVMTRRERIGLQMLGAVMALVFAFGAPVWVRLSIAFADSIGR